MAILCIKIGENAPSNYPKFDRLSKHGDIIEVLPRKVRDDGTRLPDDHSPGIMAERDYFCVAVDWSGLTDRQFAQRRAALTQSVWENTGGFDADGRALFRVAQKRRYTFDVTQAPFAPQAIRDAVLDLRDRRRLGEVVDLRANHLMAVAQPWALCAAAIIDKVSGLSLAQQPLLAAFVP